MHERDQAPKEPAPTEKPAGRGAQSAGMALQQAIGNRAMGRMLARMEATEAVEPLEKSLATGVYGAERHVAETLMHFSNDAAGFDKVAIEYQKKTEQPLMPAIDALGGEGGQLARGTVPRGFYPEISGEKYPEPKASS